MSRPPKSIGASQPSRRSPLLSADAVPVDPLPREALVAFSAQVSELLRYYDAANREDGTFAAFFDGDPTVHLSRMAAFRPAQAWTRPDGMLGIGSGSGDDKRFAYVVLSLLELADAWWRAMPAGVPRVLADEAAHVIRAHLAPVLALVRPFVSSSIPPGAFSADLWNAPAAGKLGLATVWDVEERLSQLASAARRALGILAESEPQHAAQVALYLAFVELFDVARAAVNAFADRHLSFFHGAVLGQTLLPPVPDEGTVCFVPVPKAPVTFLPAGTALLAGKDATGRARSYVLAADVSVDQVALARVVTECSRLSPAGVVEVFQGEFTPPSPPPAGSAAWTGPGFSTFGVPAAAGGSVLPIAPVELGFAVSSPLLELQGGERTIDVLLTLECPADVPVPSSDAGSLRSQLTTPGGWVNVTPTKVSWTGGSGGPVTVLFSFDLPPTFAPVAAAPASVLGPGYSAVEPSFRVLFASDRPAAVDAFFRAAEVTRVDVSVTVVGGRPQAIANTSGALVAGRPVFPLGYMPPAGAALYLGSTELLRKPLQHFALNLTWTQLPPPPVAVPLGTEVSAPGGTIKTLTVPRAPTPPASAPTPVSPLRTAPEAAQPAPVPAPAASSDSSGVLGLVGSALSFVLPDAFVKWLVNRLVTAEAAQPGLLGRLVSALFPEAVVTPPALPPAPSAGPAPATPSGASSRPTPTGSGTTPTSGSGGGTGPEPSPIIPVFFADAFGQYYNGYQLAFPYAPEDLPPFVNWSFQVQLQYRRAGGWVDFANVQPPAGRDTPLPTFSLFLSNDDGSVAKSTSLVLQAKAGTALTTPAPDLPPAVALDTIPADGVVRMQLTLPFEGFGQAQYAPAATALAMKRVAALYPQPGGTTDPNLAKLPPALNVPYTPVAEDITFDYAASTLVPAAVPEGNAENAAPAAGGTATLLTVGPGGPATLTAGGSEARFIPLQPTGGAVHLGFSGFPAATTPPQATRIDCLFVLDSKAVAADAASDGIDWKYYAASGWQTLGPETQGAVADATNGLRQSGTIRFIVPPDAADWPGQPPGLRWIRAFVATPEGRPATRAVFTHAVECRRVLDPLGDQAYDVPLAPGGITGLVVSNPAISTVVQPLPTSGGRRPEDTAAQRTRVSERLRHKNRALTAWDYERLVLQAFPTVFEAACLPGFRRASEGFVPGSAGAVAVVVHPRVADPATLTADNYPPVIDALQLAEIRRRLASVAPMAARIEVASAVYVPVRVSCEVEAAPGQDPLVVARTLDADLRAYLSPWIFSPGTARTTAWTVTRSQLLHHIRTRSYVRQVTNFSSLVGGKAVVEEQLAPDPPPYVTLVTAWQHQIVATRSG